MVRRRTNKQSKKAPAEPASHQTTHCNCCDPAASGKGLEKCCPEPNNFNAESQKRLSAMAVWGDWPTITTCRKQLENEILHFV